MEYFLLSIQIHEWITWIFFKMSLVLNLYRKHKKEDAEYYATLDNLNEAIKSCQKSAKNHDAYLMAAADMNGYDLQKYKSKMESESAETKNSGPDDSERPNKKEFERLMEGTKWNKLHR